MRKRRRDLDSLWLQLIFWGEPPMRGLEKEKLPGMPRNVFKNNCLERGASTMGNGGSENRKESL